MVLTHATAEREKINTTLLNLFEMKDIVCYQMVKNVKQAAW